jgi:Spy/CpxP family protein refolding chaperone
MNRKQFYALAFVILCASPVWGFAPERGDAIGRWLFKPEMIMKFSSQLDLSEQQQAILKAELKSAQSSIFDIKWQLNEENEKLKAILQFTPINEDEMLAQSDKVMEFERQIKRVHLTLLARLKNMLSDEQIQMLRDLRRKERMKRPR